MNYKRTRYRWNKETQSFDEYDLTVRRIRDKPFDWPAIFPDSMPAAPDCQGNMTDSWSHYKRVAKDAGKEVVHISEWADDDPSKRIRNCSDRDYEECVAKTIEQLRYGTYDDHFTEYDREMCKRMDERLKNRV